MLLVKQCCHLFASNKEAIIEKAKQLVAGQLETKDFESSILCLVSEWDKEFECCMKKLTECAQTKHLTDVKLAALSESLKTAEVEKRAMNESMDQALAKLDDLSNSSCEKQIKIKKLHDQIEKGKNDLDKAKNENEKMSKEISILSNRTSSIIDDSAENDQIASLKELVRDLECRNLNISRELFDRDELLAAKEDECDKAQTLCAEKLEALQSVITKQQADYARLVQLIPFSDSNLPLHDSVFTIEDVVDVIVKFLDTYEHEKKRLKGFVIHLMATMIMFLINKWPSTPAPAPVPMTTITTPTTATTTTATMIMTT